jgi:hypothetical protein
MGRPWADHGQTMGRPWADHGQTMGRPWECPVGPDDISGCRPLTHSAVLAWPAAGCAHSTVLAWPAAGPCLPGHLLAPALLLRWRWRLLVLVLVLVLVVLVS